MGLYSPPTADDINKLTSAADKLPVGMPVPPGFPGSDYGRDQMQQAAQANVNGQTAKGAGIATRAALTTPLVAAGETGVAGLSAIGNGVKALAVPTAGFLQGLTGYEPSAPVPPTKAQAAAGQGAAKALEASTFGQNDRGAGYDASRPGPGNPPGAKVSADNVSDWNSFVERQLSNIAGYPAGPVLAQPLPQWARTGAPGGGVTNFDTTTGAPQRVNAGYGTEIIGQGSTPVRDTGTGQIHNRISSFSGVGQGTMPEGAAGVFGPSGLPPGAAGAAGGAAASPFDQAQQSALQWMREAQAATARSDGIGARRASANAQRFAQLFSTMSQHPYNMQMADVAQQHATVAKGQLSLQAMEKQPGMAMDQATLDAIIKGDEAGAGRKRRVYAGNPAYPVTSVQAGTYGLNPNVPPGSPGSAPFYMPTPEQWRGGK